MALQYVRQKSDEEQRADAREKVAGAARRGEQPTDYYSADDLEWAFGAGHEDELAALEQQAGAVRLAKRAKQEAAPRVRQLEKMTSIVLKEWDAADAAERRAKATAEASKRLGI